MQFCTYMYYSNDVYATTDFHFIIIFLEYWSNETGHLFISSSLTVYDAESYFETRTNSILT